MLLESLVQSCATAQDLKDREQASEGVVRWKGRLSMYSSGGEQDLKLGLSCESGQELSLIIALLFFSGWEMA